MWTLFYVSVVCGPTVLLWGWDGLTERVAVARAARSYGTGRCERPVVSAPDGICGMPIVARLDLLAGDAYSHLQWLCYDHATDVERRATDRYFRLTWLNSSKRPRVRVG